MAIQMREKALEERLYEVQQRESNLLMREMMVKKREQAAEEKMKSAETLIQQFKELQSLRNGVGR